MSTPSTTSIQAPDGNIFAHVLNEILTSHGYRLGLIDNRTDIHSQKVARLQHSLHDPTRIHLLNPEDLEKVIETFGIAASQTEVLRLRAAVVAAAIQKTLLDRINYADALQAVQELFPIIYQALSKSSQPSQPSQVATGMNSIRNDNATAQGKDTVDGAFTGALEALDHATIALQLSTHVDSSLERILRLQEAHASFQLASTLLDEMPAQMKATSEWRVWQADAEQGNQYAMNRLEDEDGRV